MKRALLHYRAHTCSLNLKRNDPGDCEKLTWVIQDMIPEGEVFYEGMRDRDK